MPQTSEPIGPIAICAIATRSHEPLALEALRRFGRGLPGATLVLLRIDPDRSVETGDIASRSVEDCVPKAQWTAMRRRYSASESCFALKPFLIDRLLAEGFEQVHYVDADCHALGGLGPLVEDLRSGDLLLTPHTTRPIPDDGRTPAALTVLRAGVFNGGYIGVRATPQGREFAAWLASMTQNQAHNRPAAGMCGDQRWLDLAPALFPGLVVCRRRGANVGYWNLHERPLTRQQDGGYCAGGEAVLFFHFSGFEPARPDRLSRHQNRHALVRGEPLYALVQEYLEHLRSVGLARAPAPPRRRGRIVDRVLGRGRGRPG